MPVIHLDLLLVVSGSIGKDITISEFLYVKKITILCAFSFLISSPQVFSKGQAGSAQTL